MRKLLAYGVLIVLTLLSGGPACGDPFEGYTLFSPKQGSTAFLINMDGQVVHYWATPHLAGSSGYLLEDGTLLRPYYVNNPVFPGTHGGHVQRLAWDGSVLWEFDYSSETRMQHHDIEPLPNGNILMVAYEYKSMEQCIAAGRDPSLLNQGYLVPDTIVEVEPSGPDGGTIVWEWHIWDHLVQDFDPTRENYGVVAEHPELVDINYAFSGNADWTHCNSVAYNEVLDQIVISAYGMCEIYVVDHSTTTEEAAGHSGGNSGKGGDILYRWGNPQVYRAGTSDEQKFWFQHDAEWIEEGCPGAGNILVFNNGLGRPGGNYSSVEEIVPPVDSGGAYSLTPGEAYGPAEPLWIYADPENFMSGFMAGSQRLPNGDTLICEAGSGHFFEVTLSGETVWEYTNLYPMNYWNTVFKIERYAPGYPGLVNLTGTVGAKLTCRPVMGTVPFSTSITVMLANRCSGLSRRCSGRIDVDTAGGASYTGWRSGWANVAAGGSHLTSWAQIIPALGSFIGDSTFTLVVEDVTPPPYNLPPYPPAGDTAGSACTVTGVAP